MSYVLVGSHPSPFVRRLRLLMEGIPYEFKAMNIYEKEGAEELHRLNPTHQIPLLLENGKPVWDSRVIFNHLNRAHGLEKMDIDKENLLTVMERMLDAAIAKFLLVNRSGVPADSDMMYLQRQRDRMDSTFEWLQTWMRSEAAEQWSFPTMTLYSALDWIQFREVHPLGQRPETAAFLARHAHRAVVQATDPRKV
jgi:glutathione S-transferase